MSAPKEQPNVALARKLYEAHEPNHKKQPFHQHMMGRKLLMELAEEIGASFKVIRKHKQATNPNVLYFLPATADPAFTQLEEPPNGGYMFWRWTYKQIEWHPDDIVSKASVRKWLEDPHSLDDCVVCFDEVRPTQYIDCTKCGALVCNACFYKVNLTEEAISRISRGDWTYICSFPNKCVQCRLPFRYDIRNSYYQMFDRLDEFNPAQRKCLETLRDHDSDFEEFRRNWTRAWSVKVLKKGDLVLLHGLNKEEWNGKVAVIEGRASNKNGVQKWPIELKDEPYAKAWAKESNLKRVMSAKTRFIRLCQ